MVRMNLLVNDELTSKQRKRIVKLKSTFEMHCCNYKMFVI